LSIEYRCMGFRRFIYNVLFVSNYDYLTVRFCLKPTKNLYSAFITCKNSTWFLYLHKNRLNFYKINLILVIFTKSIWFCGYTKSDSQFWSTKKIQIKPALDPCFKIVNQILHSNWVNFCKSQGNFCVRFFVKMQISYKSQFNFLVSF